MTIYVMPDGYKPGDTLPEPEPEPEPEMVEVTAIEVYCNYYGDTFGGPGYNYFITLTDVGFDENGYVMSNSKNYVLDLYSEIATEGNEGTIPAGTYTLDLGDTMASGTIGYQQSLYFTIDESGMMTERKFSWAKLVVDQSGLMTLSAAIDRQRHEVTFNGAPNIDNIMDL